MKIFDKNVLIDAFDIKNVDEQKEQILKDFKDTPEFFARFVCKGLVNYMVMDMLYSRRYGEKYEDSKKVIKLKLFTSFYHYILRIPLESFNKALIDVDSQEQGDILTLYNALDTLITYFEEIEMYEKCEKLVKYQKKLQYDSIQELLLES